MTDLLASHWVGGAWQTLGMRRQTLRSPVDDSLLALWQPAQPADVPQAVELAAAARGPLAALPVAQRAAALRALAAALEADTAALAALLTLEIGCPSAQSPRLQVGSAVGLLRAMAGIAEGFVFTEQRPAARGGRVRIDHLPLGLAVGIVPWNVPIFLACAKLASALVAGCPIILKPSPENAASMARFAAHLAALDLPPGAVNLMVGDRDLGAALVDHPLVAKVSFTGSTAAGREVAVACARRLARCTLELGGKSAAILLDDVDLPAVRDELFLAMLQNNGQVCGAQSRVLIPASRAAELRSALIALFDDLVVGDPRAPDTDIGPLASSVQAGRVRSLLDLAQAEGARVLNRRPEVAVGALVAPALLDQVGTDHMIWRQEAFGPVVVLATYRDEDEALALAAATEYGLSGSVWSADPARAEAVACRLRTGTVGVNSRRILDFAAPFGGFGDSGIGRELGPEGIAAYLETRSILLP